MIVEDNIIYVSDNFGYLYAYNYKTKVSYGQKIIKYLSDPI